MYATAISVYPANDYRYYQYLAHHGVRGQRWGVRRYQNYDGSLTSAGRARIAGDGQGFKARMKIRKEGIANDVKDTIASVKAAKGIVEKGSELVGHGRGETHQRNKMFTQERLKNASTTRFGKHIHDVSAYNAKSSADYHSVKRGQSVGRRIGELVVPVTLYKKPMKTITGRKTTVGMELLANTIAGGPIGNLALAGAYHASKGVRSSVNEHVDKRSAQQYAKAKASYDKGPRAADNGTTPISGSMRPTQSNSIPLNTKKRSRK